MYQKAIGSLVDLRKAAANRWSMRGHINSAYIPMPLHRMMHLPLISHFTKRGVLDLLILYIVFKKNEQPSAYFTDQVLYSDVWLQQHCEIASLFYNSFETDKAFWYAPLPEEEVVNEDKVLPDGG